MTGMRLFGAGKRRAYKAIRDKYETGEQGREKHKSGAKGRLN